MQNAEMGKFKKFDAKNYKVGIVVAQFNSGITSELLASAKTMLKKYGVTKHKVVHVAGSIEVPVVLQKMAKSKKFTCLVALGAVIRGETAHFDYVCKIVSEGVLRVMLDYNLPVGFGIITVDSEAQARARFGVGGGAVEAALQTARTLQEI